MSKKSKVYENKAVKIRAKSLMFKRKKLVKL